MLEGLQAAQARISLIQQRFVVATPATGTSFADVLADELATPAVDAAAPVTVADDASGTAVVASARATSDRAVTTTLDDWLGSSSVATGAAGTPSTPATPLLGTAPATGGAGVWPTTGTAGWLVSPSVDGLTPAVPRAPGAYGRLAAPPELAAHGNGRIPQDLLAPIGVGGHRLYGPAASSYVRMVADAAAQGVTIGITDSYRTYDEQVDLAARKGLYSQGGWAATPGTSNHGWGLAVDLDLDDAAGSWMQANGWRYGWVETVPREPWHYEYRPAGAGS